MVADRSIRWKMRLEPAELLNDRLGCVSLTSREFSDYEL